jgi:hypothetical protein
MNLFSYYNRLVKYLYILYLSVCFTFFHGSILGISAMLKAPKLQNVEMRFCAISADEEYRESAYSYAVLLLLS